MIYMKKRDCLQFDVCRILGVSNGDQLGRMLDKSSQMIDNANIRRLMNWLLVDLIV